MGCKQESNQYAPGQKRGTLPGICTGARQQNRPLALLALSASWDLFFLLEHSLEIALDEGSDDNLYLPPVQSR